MPEVSSPKALREDYVAGRIGDKDICELLLRGVITMEEAEFITGKSDVEITRMCREMASRDEVVEEAEYARKRGRFGGFGKGAVAAESPSMQVLASLAAESATYATQQLQFWMQIGRFVYTVAYPKCLTDPRYRDKAQVNPMEAVQQYVVDALAFYSAHQEILNEYRETIGYLLDLLERYRQALRRFAPLEIQRRLEEEERKKLVYLLDRYIAARILGIDLRKLGRIVLKLERAKALYRIYSQLLRRFSTVVA